jgi:hypothetical protein
MGVNFVEFIKDELEKCIVLLTIIGRDWLTVQDPRRKRRRLDNPEDFLRLELATALKNAHVRVMPVLVDHAAMPTIEDLSDDLSALAHLTPIELRDAQWESDVERLLDTIEQEVARTMGTYMKRRSLLSGQRNM